MWRVVELLDCWQGCFGSSESGVIWKAIPSCLTWSLWSEINARTFKVEAKTLPMLKFSFLQHLFEWLQASRSVSFNCV